MRRSLLALVFLAPLAAAQPTPAGCETGQAEAFLDVAGARAALYNIGGLFWRGGPAQYEVPNRSGLVAVFSASLMVGGFVDGELRFAGSTYGPWEFWPGPLDPGASTTPERCAALDRIWTVRTADLEAYDATGASTADLREWPVAWGAPFYTDADGDGRQGPGEPTVSLDPGDAGYGTRALDLEAGERPVVFGRQTAWWVMNDVGNVHRWSTWSDDGSTGDPLGVEVRATAWVQGAADEPDLYESTFYRYEIVNRSAEPIEALHAGLYVDSDLGNFSDDRVGTDSTRQMLVFYNGDELDEDGGGYGSPPPALGIDMLSGAYAALPPYKNGIWGEPGSAVEGYRYLRGFWRNGDTLRVGGFGYDTDGPQTRWGFSGDVVTRSYWSQENYDGQGSSFVPSDKRGMISAGPADLAPGERITVDLAFLFARGADRLDSVVELRRVSERAQALYESGALLEAVSDPPAPAAPPLIAPVEGASLDGDEATFSWQAVPGAERYELEIFASEDAETPIRTEYVEAPSATVRLGWLPINRRDPFVWRVRAFRLGVASPVTETRSFTSFRPGFDRVTVAANADGPLDPPRTVQSFRDALEPNQRNGSLWLASSESGLRGDALSRAYPHDYEVRFQPVTEAQGTLIRASDGLRVRAPIEVWDIGVGTPDDPADDVRLIPVFEDLDGDGRFSTPADAYGYAERTESIAWYLPLDTTPGEAGYRAWAEARDRSLPDSSRLLVPDVGFFRYDARSGTAPPQPEPGTVFRFESSSLTLPVGDVEAPTPLALVVRPNPASTRAAVGIALEAPAAVRLTVVDVLGREALVLVDGEREAGEHRVGLDASRLAAGVYVVVLEAGGERVTRTMTVAR